MLTVVWMIKHPTASPKEQPSLCNYIITELKNIKPGKKIKGNCNDPLTPDPHKQKIGCGRDDASANKMVQPGALTLKVSTGICPPQDSFLGHFFWFRRSTISSFSSAPDRDLTYIFKKFLTSSSQIFSNFG